MAIDALTDPDEIALYQQYGPNWRRVIGSGMRDRGGRYDRNMRFNHGVPTGFLTRPVAPQAFSPSPSIDTGAYEKYRQEYNRLMEEYNSLLNQYNDFNSQQNNSYQDTAYDQQQQYYQDNYNAAYGQNNETSSQTDQYVRPMEFLSSPSSNYLMDFNPQMNIGGDVMAGSSTQGLTSGSRINPLSQADLTVRPIMSDSYNRTYMTNPASVRTGPLAAPAQFAFENTPPSSRTITSGSGSGSSGLMGTVGMPAPSAAQSNALASALSQRGLASVIPNNNSTVSKVKSVTSFKTSKGNVGRK